MSLSSLMQAVHSRGLELGFARVGSCSAEPFAQAAQHLERWLARGQHGEMRYLNGPDDRADPSALLQGARSILVAALPYPRSEPERPARKLTGHVGRYARGADYHRVIRDKLVQLVAFIAAELGHPVRSRVCVDTAPLLEREAARRAGIAFVGKNTMAIAPGLGSNFLLGSVLLDVELGNPSEALADGCGSCRACIDACPTQAFVDAYDLDARRCISYLTIELQGAIPSQLRRAVGTRVFGCDTCQDVCPYNRTAKAPDPSPSLAAHDKLEHPDLLGWLRMTSTDYRRLVKGTSLRRASRERLQRNAAVALGNTRDASVLPQLEKQLSESKSALVRQHCAWALGEIGGAQARSALQQALNDSASEVREEARSALEQHVQER